MPPDMTQLLVRLAQARSIPLRPLPVSRWLTTSDGVRLHYLDWEGGPETLIALHGGALSAHSFDLMALALGDQVRCIALDLRGHGDSGWSQTYSVERWAADICEMVDELGLVGFHLAGMSLGGCIGGHAAPALGDRLASLTFIDVADQVSFAASAGMRRFIEAVRPVARVEDLVAQALAVSPRTDPDLMAYRYQSLLKPGAGGFTWRADRRRPTDFPHILGKLADLTGLAPQITCPVRVLKGARSRVLSPQTLQRFAGLFPGGDWAVIPDAGHNIQEDQPRALAAELSEMFARVALGLTKA